MSYFLDTVFQRRGATRSIAWMDWRGCESIGRGVGRMQRIGVENEIDGIPRQFNLAGADILTVEISLAVV
jgi:hypothetical protein